MAATEPATPPGPPLRPSCCGFPVLALLVGFCLLAALGWTRWVLPLYNSDHLGGDACHHVIMIHAQSVPNLAERNAILGYYHNYPQTTHWLASWLTPLLDHDPYKAMRAFALANLLLLVLVHFVIFRSVASSNGTALLMLMVWELLAHQTNTSDPRLAVTYFFSQIFGLLAMWWALFLVDWPATGLPARLLLLAAGTGLAGVAYLGHIVPGASILAALGLYGFLRTVRSRAWLDALSLVLLVGVGLLVVLGTGQFRHMADSRAADGYVPLRNSVLVWLWVPTLVIGVLGHGRRWLERGERAPGDVWLEKLLCLLAAAGALHLYCLWEWSQGRAAAYASRKFFYILCPATMMVWVLAVVRWLPARASLPSRGRWLRQGLGLAFVVFSLVTTFQFHIRNELLAEPCNEGRDPAHVSKELASRLQPADPALRASWRSDCVYFDPALPRGSVFVNVVALRHPVHEANLIKDALQNGWRPGMELLRGLRAKETFRRLLLPDDLGSRRESSRKSPSVTRRGLE